MAIKFVLDQTKTSDLFIALGDFNLPDILWNKPAEVNYLIPLGTNQFIQSLLTCGLSQINHVRNAFGKLLDLAFVNQPSDILLQNTPPITHPEDRYHPTLQLDICLPTNVSHLESNKNFHNKVFCFSRVDYTKFNYLLSTADWSTTISGDNLDNIVLKFYDILHYCISETVPKVIFRNNKGPPWSNGYLSNVKNRKSKLYKKYKISGSTVDFRNYCIIRAEYNTANKLAYNSYLRRMKAKIKTNPKAFYKLINSKRRANAYPKYLKFGSRIADDDVSVSNLFADFFATTYSNKSFNNQTSYPYNISHSSSINLSFVDTETVLSNLKSLQSSFIPGPDGIPNCILKKCAEQLCGPLTAIFNKSIELGHMPFVWKKSYLTPLFKNGSKLEVSNYRGIAKLNAIPKLLEKILTESLYHQITSLLSPRQHGFRKLRSTTTNILELTTIVNEGFINNKQTDVIYTDFSKAFDKVNHDILLYKLSRMGFSNNAIRWLNSYLSNRTQQVKFKNSTSKIIEVSSGVPQGSHLGPVLFTLFINDLPSVILHSNILMYADDVKIFYSFNDITGQTFLRADLEYFSQWCIINLLELNIKKCKHMSFFRSFKLDTNYFLNETKLENVDNIVDLGILLDHKLKFCDHISMTVNKASGVLGFMKRWSKEFSDPYITKHLFTSLVRPILEYGSIIWDPCFNTHINSIESVQKQFLLFCLRGLGWNSHVLPSYESRLCLIKLPTLKSRRIMLSVLFVLGLIRGDVDSEYLLSKLNFNVPTRPSRNFQLLSLKYYRTVYANNDSFRQICLNFNNLYHLIDLSENYDTLKRKIILYLNY